MLPRARPERRSTEPLMLRLSGLPLGCALRCPGEALHIGVLGGSISCGMAARNFYGTYAALFRVSNCVGLRGCWAAA